MPLSAVARALTESDPAHELHYIGEGTEMEQCVLMDHDATMTMHKIKAGKFRRYNGQSIWRQLLDIPTLLLNLRDSFKAAIGFLQSLVLLARIRPDVVFSKGGYTALPVGLAAACLRIRIVTHDSDMTPGLTNRLLRRFADVRACGFPREGSVFTGNPVRPEVISSRPADLGTDKPVVLVMGGSQGSIAINRVIFESMAELTSRYTIVHITGAQDASNSPNSSRDYMPYDFVDGREIGQLIKAADVVVSRAGATVIAELAACGAPTVLIPGVHMTAGQQLKNADAVANKEAAYVLEESKMNPGTLIEAIEHVRKHKQSYRRHIRQLDSSNAASALAKLITGGSVSSDTNTNGSKPKAAK